MDQLVQDECRMQGPGLQALTADRVQRWRAGLQTALRDVVALSKRRQMAEDDEKARAKKIKVGAALRVVHASP